MTERFHLTKTRKLISIGLLALSVGITGCGEKEVTGPKQPSEAGLTEALKSQLIKAPEFAEFSIFAGFLACNNSDISIQKSEKNQDEYGISFYWGENLDQNDRERFTYNLIDIISSYRSVTNDMGFANWYEVYRDLYPVFQENLEEFCEPLNKAIKI